MEGWQGPHPSPGFKGLMGKAIEPPLRHELSGEIVASTGAIPIGSPMQGGVIADAFISVLASGKDDSNDLSLEVDVFKNGYSIFETKPKIAHVSGEDSEQKTTAMTGDTGITEAVLNNSGAYDPGDVLTAKYTLTRTASPTTEMANACLVVSLRPGN